MFICHICSCAAVTNTFRFHMTVLRLRMSNTEEKKKKSQIFLGDCVNDCKEWGCISRPPEGALSRTLAINCSLYGYFLLLQSCLTQRYFAKYCQSFHCLTERFSIACFVVLLLWPLYLSCWITVIALFAWLDWLLVTDYLAYFIDHVSVLELFTEFIKLPAFGFYIHLHV